MIVDSSNNLILTFNDTMNEVQINSTDLYISIYGPESSYDFTWSAYYLSETQVYVVLNINTYLIGSKSEQIGVEFLNENAFVSTNSERGISSEYQKYGYLNANSVSSSAGSVGQTTMILFFASLSLSILSSFGGNSPELMWNLTNTLQQFYILSKVYVQFPTLANDFFSYIQYSNAKNQYLSDVTFFILSSNYYTRGSVNK